MSRNPNHTPTNETEIDHRFRRGAIALGAAVAVLFSAENISGNTALPEASAATYSIGGTGDPHGKDLPRAGVSKKPNKNIAYPADPINMPTSIGRGVRAIKRSGAKPGDTVIGFSQGAKAAHESPTRADLILIANPNRPDLNGSGRSGIAHRAIQLGFPDFRVKNPSETRDRRTTNICIQGDPICDSPKNPLKNPGGAINGYLGAHLGLDPKANYNNLRNLRPVVTKRGNQTDILYVPKHPKNKSAPARTPAVAPVQTSLEAPVYATPQPAPEAPAVVQDIASQATAAAPHLAPQIKQLQQDITPHLNNISNIIPGLQLPR